MDLVFYRKSLVLISLILLSLLSVWWMRPLAEELSGVQILLSEEPLALDDDQEICFDYDDQGRLVRIRKERRMDALSIKILIWVGGILFSALVFFLSER